MQKHQWPHGFDETLEEEGTPIVAHVTAGHASKARERGIPPEKHIRNVLAVPEYAPALLGPLRPKHEPCRVFVVSLLCCCTDAGRP